MKAKDISLKIKLFLWMYYFYKKKNNNLLNFRTLKDSYLVVNFIKGS